MTSTTPAFTIDALRSEAARHYASEGYCLMEGLFSPGEIEEIEGFFEQLKQREHVEMFNGVDRFDQLDITKSIPRAMHPHRHYPDPINRWFLHPNVAEVLEALLGCPALGVQTMYYFKPPGSVGQQMHQDNFFLLAKPHSCIAAWTAIDDTDEENGCLFVAPGSHREETLCAQSLADPQAVYSPQFTHEQLENFQQVPIRMRRGQTLFFGGQLIHGSHPNQSATRSRRSFIGHYVDAVTESLSKYYFPILDMQGNQVSGVKQHQGGGPCADLPWEGAVH